MLKEHNLIRETHRVGAETREWLVAYGNEHILTAYGFHAVGWVEAREGYCIVRPDAPLAMLYVCLEGWGEVLEKGVWQRCEAGQAYIAPMGHLQAYRAVPGVMWRNVWVVGQNSSLLDVPYPSVVNASGQALYCAVQGLYNEDTGTAAPALIEGWVKLISQYVQRIGHQGEVPTGRLTGVWERVVADLSLPWTVQMLAREASLSEESVRRICLRETGHSPMGYVTYLRMRSAASILVSHPCTIADVAQQVGYANPFAFSTAFKRTLGLSPAQFRQEAKHSTTG